MRHRYLSAIEEVSPDEKTARVGHVFAGVARRYDLMNDLMSGGMHRLWKDRFVRRVQPRTGEAILDMAGGTGDIAFRLAKSGAQVTVADINPEMLAVGQRAGRKARHRGSGLDRAECGDAELRRQQLRRLHDRVRHPERHPYRPSARRSASGAEARRALLLPRILDHHLAGLRRQSTIAIRTTSCRRSASAVAHDEDSYRYLVESIRRFPTMETVQRQ